MTDSPEPEQPIDLHAEADKPTQESLDDQRDAVGDEPQAGDEGGHS